MQRGPVHPKFQVEGVTPTNYSSSQKTKLHYLSYGIKIWTDLSSVLSQSTRLTDRQTDRQTDSFFIARSRLHCMQCGKKLSPNTQSWGNDLNHWAVGNYVHFGPPVTSVPGHFGLLKRLPKRSDQGPKCHNYWLRHSGPICPSNVHIQAQLSQYMTTAVARDPSPECSIKFQDSLKTRYYNK